MTRNCAGRKQVGNEFSSMFSFFSLQHCLHSAFIFFTTSWQQFLRLHSLWWAGSQVSHVVIGDECGGGGRMRGVTVFGCEVPVARVGTSHSFRVNKRFLLPNILPHSPPSNPISPCDPAHDPPWPTPCDPWATFEAVALGHFPLISNLTSRPLSITDGVMGIFFNFYPHSQLLIWAPKSSSTGDICQWCSSDIYIICGWNGSHSSSLSHRWSRLVCFFWGTSGDLSWAIGFWMFLSHWNPANLRYDTRETRLRC